MIRPSGMPIFTLITPRFEDIEIVAQIGSLHGANMVGTPDEIIERALLHHEIFGHQRFLLQISVGTLPHAQVLKAIELFGTEVAPVLRREIASRQAA